MKEHFGVDSSTKIEHIFLFAKFLNQLLNNYIIITNCKNFRWFYLEYFTFCSNFAVNIQNTPQDEQRFGLG